MSEIDSPQAAQAAGPVVRAAWDAAAWAAAGGAVSRDEDRTVTIRATGSGPRLLALLEAAARIDGAEIHCGSAEDSSIEVAAPEWDRDRARRLWLRAGAAQRYAAVATSGFSLHVLDACLFGHQQPTHDEARAIYRALGLGGAS